LFDGLRWIFREWSRVPESVLEQGPGAVLAYTTELETRFGFAVGLSRSAVHGYAQGLLSENRYDQAEKLFALNVELHPSLPFTHESLGRAYEAGGRLEAALACFKTAVKRAEDGSYPDVQRYRDHVQRVRQKIARESLPEAGE
jgi:tetratricopeptide (TPR) repeat protein